MRRYYLFDPIKRDGWILTVRLPERQVAWLARLAEKVLGHPVDYTDDADTAVGLL